VPDIWLPGRAERGSRPSKRSSRGLRRTHGHTPRNNPAPLPEQRAVFVFAVPDGLEVIVDDCLIEEVRLATDFSLEGAGFEPPVPLVRPIPEWLEKRRQSFVRMVSRDACAPVKCAGGDAILTIEMVRWAPISRPNALPKLPVSSLPGRVGDIVATGRLRRSFWRVADELHYLWTLATLRVLDAIVGPEPETPADQQRARDRERIERAFPKDFWGRSSE
jgi:hypothetical protein